MAVFVVRHRRRLAAAVVAHAAAAVERRVGVQELAPVAAVRYAEPIVLARHRREVADHQDRRRALVALAQERDHALLPVAALHPAEAVVHEVLLVQRRLLAQHAVEVRHPAAHALVALIHAKRVPLEARFVRPLAALTELATHEEELLARMRPHVAEERAQVGELLPRVARHAPDQRALAVHDLVMRERQHEILVERVPQAEGQLIVTKLAEHGIVLHVAQRVVHPAHVPLHAEAEAPEIRRARHLRPGGGFLGDGLRVRIVAIEGLVQELEKGDGLQVLPPAVAVRHPLACLSPVVEVQHGRHGVHAQAIDVVLVEPEARTRGEERAHFVPAVVEDRARPVRVMALARIGVLVEVRAVEETEPVLVPGEVRRHPVEDDADARLVKRIDEVHEVLGRAVARRGREVARALVAPGAVKRMLHDRQQLDVREAHALAVLGELRREIAVAQNLRWVIRRAAPGTEMHLVDRPWRIERVAVLAVGHPGAVVPFERQVPDHGAGARRLFGAKRVRIGLVYLVTGMARNDMKFVHAAGLRLRHPHRPDTRVAGRTHRAGARVPAVPVAHDRNGLRVRRPDREMRFVAEEVRAELFVEPAVRAFAKEILVVPREGNRSFSHCGHGRPPCSKTRPRLPSRPSSVVSYSL